MTDKITIPHALRPALGDKFAKIASLAGLFNRETEHNNRLSYLNQLRGQARAVADAEVSQLKYSTLTTDQKIEVMSDHRAAGLQVLALCDAVIL